MVIFKNQPSAPLIATGSTYLIKWKEKGRAGEGAGRKDPMCGSAVSTRADSCEDRWQKAGLHHPRAVLPALHKADVWKEQQQQHFLLPHQ